MCFRKKEIILQCSLCKVPRYSPLVPVHIQWQLSDVSSVASKSMQAPSFGDQRPGAPTLLSMYVNVSELDSLASEMDLSHNWCKLMKFVDCSALNLKKWRKTHLKCKLTQRVPYRRHWVPSLEIHSNRFGFLYTRWGTSDAPSARIFRMCYCSSMLLLSVNDESKRFRRKFHSALV